MIVPGAFFEGQQRFVDAREHGEIAIHAHRQVSIGQLGTATNQTVRALGILETDESRLG